MIMFIWAIAQVSGTYSWPYSFSGATGWRSEGQIEIGDTFKNPRFRDGSGRLRTFDRVVANPMWNQD